MAGHHTLQSQLTGAQWNQEEPLPPLLSLQHPLLMKPNIRPNGKEELFQNCKQDSERYVGENQWADNWQPHLHSLSHGFHHTRDKNIDTANGNEDSQVPRPIKNI